VKPLRSSNKIKALLAIGAGGALPLAFAPFALFPLAIVSLMVLLRLWQQVAPASALSYGFLYGLGLFGVGISWVSISFYQFGHMPLAAAGLLTLAFVAFMALYPALLGGLLNRFFPQENTLKSLLIIPAAWSSMEWFRGWFLTGFPWLAMGYSQIDSPLRGYAPLLGVYGISWLTVLTASGCLFAWQNRRYRKAVMALVILIWAGGWLAHTRHWTQAVDKPLDVALIQGNIPQEFKWLADYQWPSIQRYLTLSQQHRSADLIIWPETAIPLFYHQVPELIEFLEKEHNTYGVDFLMGVPIMAADGRYFNAVMSLSDSSGFYAKRHLVPFGEYIPLQAFLGNLLKLLEVPLSEFSAGAWQQSYLHAAGQKIGISICYEDSFSALIRSSLPAATVLVNVSNDAWFGNSIAPHQHLEIARMRALESGRYLIRVTNTGISAIINPQGQLMMRTAQFEIETLRTQIQPYQGLTPYMRWGNGLTMSLLMMLLAIGIMLRFRQDNA